MTQLNLFESLPHQPHSATSKAAAEQAKPTATTMRAEVFELLEARAEYGATDEEIATCCNMNPSTARPRRIDLVKSGEVVDSGRTRLTKSNRESTVWILGKYKHSGAGRQ